jgi:anti-sigma regulatory factor (Ser/Thr protein kinase)
MAHSSSVAEVVALLDEGDTGRRDDVPHEPAPVEPPPVAAAEISVALADSPAVISDARATATGALLAWACPGGARQDAVVVVSELVTNAVLHAAAPVRLRLALAHPPEGSVLRIEVSDGSPTPPRPRTPTRDLPDGRGLHIVQALAGRYGVLETTEGKTVWAEITLEPDAA